MKKIFYVTLIVLIMTACKTNNSKNDTTKTQIKLEAIELVNNNGMKVKITNFGASIMSIQFPDKNGELGELVLGYDKAEDYLDGNLYFGVVLFLSYFFICL